MTVFDARWAWPLVALLAGAAGFGLGVRRTLPLTLEARLSAQRGALAELDQRLARLEFGQRTLAGICAWRPPETPLSAAAAPAPCPIPSAALPAAAREPADAEQASDPDAPDTDAESERAIASSRRLIESAVSSGRWTEADVAELRSSTSRLNGEQQHELFRTLSHHFTSGKLHFEGQGSPF